MFFCVHALCISVFDCVTSHTCPLCCVRCIACVAYDNLETVCRPTKMELKVCFQAAVCNAMDATHAGHATQIKKTATHAHEKCNGRKDISGCVRGVFSMRAYYLFQFF